MRHYGAGDQFVLCDEGAEEPRRRKWIGGDNYRMLAGVLTDDAPQVGKID